MLFGFFLLSLLSCFVPSISCPASICFRCYCSLFFSAAALWSFAITSDEEDGEQEQREKRRAQLVTFEGENKTKKKRTWVIMMKKVKLLHGLMAAAGVELGTRDFYVCGFVFLFYFSFVYFKVVPL